MFKTASKNHLNLQPNEKWPRHLEVDDRSSFRKPHTERREPRRTWNWRCEDTTCIPGLRRMTARSNRVYQHSPVSGYICVYAPITVLRRLESTCTWIVRNEQFASDETCQPTWLLRRKRTRDPNSLWWAELQLDALVPHISGEAVRQVPQYCRYRSIDWSHTSNNAATSPSSFDLMPAHGLRPQLRITNRDLHKVWAVDRPGPREDSTAAHSWIWSYEARN